MVRKEKGSTFCETNEFEFNDLMEILFNFRTSGGRLHLVPDIGKIPLADALLIEDPSEHGINDDDGKNIICLLKLCEFCSFFHCLIQDYNLCPMHLSCFTVKLLLKINFHMALLSLSKQYLIYPQPNSRNRALSRNITSHYVLFDLIKIIFKAVTGTLTF